jgi:tubulin polyglutamylase TTLL4
MKLKLVSQSSSNDYKKKKQSTKTKKSKGAKTVGEGLDEEVMEVLDSQLDQLVI